LKHCPLQKIVRAAPNSDLYKNFEDNKVINNIIDSSASKNNNNPEPDASKLVVYKSSKPNIDSPIESPDPKEIQKLSRIIENADADITLDPKLMAKTNLNTTANKITQKGDTLSQIAEKYAIAHGISRRQMVVAIYESNKKAFIHNNMNKLKQNFKLVIPDAIEAKSIASKVGVSLAKNDRSNKIKNLKKDQNKLAKLTNKLKTTKLNTPKEPPAPKPTEVPPQKQPIEVPVPSQPIEIPPPVQPSQPSTPTEIPTIGQFDKNKDTSLDLKDLSKFASTKEDIAKTKRIIRNKRLEIVSEQAENTPTNNLLLNAEKLVAKQKENAELKEQLLLLQAQLRDMQKLAGLNSTAITNNNTSPKSAQLQGSYNKADKVVQSIPLSPMPIGAHAVPNSNGEENINGHSDNSNITEKVAARNSLTGYLGVMANSLSKTGKKLTYNNTKNIFYLWLGVLGFVIAALGFIYYYSIRQFKDKNDNLTLEPDLIHIKDDVLMADLMSDLDIDLDLAVDPDTVEQSKSKEPEPVI